jgi:hypothetical protein
MKHLVSVLFIGICMWLTPCKGEDPYSSLQSIEEVIRFETSLILNTDPYDLAYVSQLYLSRGESHLLCGKNLLAYDDFQQGYALANLCGEEEKKALQFRGLFGLAIVYGCEEMIDEFNCTSESLKSILSSYTCPCNQGHQPLSIGKGISPHIYAKKPILGPDQISIDDCIDFSKSTAERCGYLISLVPKAAVKVTLQILINDLEKRAISCCKAGGIWKACLQPLVDKWQLWNEKWNLFKIPPDPTWD